ncbi:MAG TPA: response regulator transcription factor [Mobilitalea sp.]|nr:response regulator transcription factor [Mobilitalea sp.]
MKMKLMLVDDHLLFMESLQYLLEMNGIQVLGKARDGREAIAKARILNPDIILMDIRMPRCNGLDALRLIKAEMPEIKIIMLTTSEEEDDLFNAIKFGASGYLFKNTDAKDLINMLEQTANNEASISPDLAIKLIDEFRLYNREDNISSQSISNREDNIFSQSIPNHEEVESLTDRQREILVMVAEGKTYKEVGEILGLKERTIKYHMGKMLEYLHLENRSQVIAYAARNRITDN